MKRRFLLFAVLCLVLSISVPAGASTTSPSPTVRSEEHWCQRGEKRIYGVLYRPETAQGRLPLVIVSHGFGGNNQWGKPYAEVLTKRGYLVYCFDFCGGGNRSRSDGKTTEMSIFTERDDLKAVLHNLRQLPEVDTTRITLMGESQGGIVTAITAAEVEPLVHDIVLFYPAFCIPDDSRRRFPNPQDMPEEGEIWGVKLGRCYGEGLYDYDVYKVIGTFRKPVLIVHGDSDRIVPVSYSDRAAQKYHDVEYHVLHGVDHGYQGLAQWLATEFVVEFLARQGK